jgi:hypothetical protein
MQHSFSLLPFPKQPAPEIQISGQANYLDHHLSLSYQVTGQWHHLDLPPLSNHPARLDELWQTTCFEFFLGKINDPSYWEFNLSPSGNWNVYHFEDYRQGMQEEGANATLPYQVLTLSTGLELNLSLDLSLLIPAETPLEIAITAVIKTTPEHQGSISYWALAHKTLQPDFHQRNSFILAL